MQQNLNHQNNNLNNGVDKPSRSRQIVRSFEAKLSGRKTRAERITDYLTRIFGSMNFFLFNLSWFSVWLIWNFGLVPFLPVFDPYPFVLLITIVSLEAICLSVLVLITQNRAAKVDRLRSEVDLQINMIAEQEITKAISLLGILLEKHGINIQEDPEIQKMLKRVDLWGIEKKLEKQLLDE
ncbi:MAG: DUF1003 domain-containing protein [Candidatus Harrisonbacteria bacterium]|nr:DUF1003 domain-containing protein [Candidatus Harrisonbacteria bacterium]